MCRPPALSAAPIGTRTTCVIMRTDIYAWRLSHNGVQRRFLFMTYAFVEDNTQTS